MLRNLSMREARFGLVADASFDDLEVVDQILDFIANRLKLLSFFANCLGSHLLLKFKQERVHPPAREGTRKVQLSSPL